MSKIKKETKEKVAKYFEEIRDKFFSDLGVPSDLYDYTDIDETYENHMHKFWGGVFEEALKDPETLQKEHPDRTYLEDGRWTKLKKVPKCEYCPHCTDTFYDCTNGDYLWLCNLKHIGEYNLDTGMLNNCPLEEETKNERESS